MRPRRGCYAQQPQAGFTMIELISVIVILAVLAAVALPKFLDLGQQARIAKVNAMAAQLHTVAATSQSLCALVLPTCLKTPTVNGIILLGKARRVNYGYPDAGAFLTDLYINGWVDTSGWTVSVPSIASTKFALTDAPTPDNCAVTYNDAFHGEGNYSINIITSGC